tara:strand:+ start:1239 stop:1697 length:459 start_codon:yes stop_codon:yes gene_type:complete
VEKIIMLKLTKLKTFLLTFLILSSFSFNNVNGFEITKNPSEGNFKVTSWKAGNGYSVITSQGTVEGYGKVYLTHKFKANSPEALTGDFVGAARAITKDGKMNFASLQGVWKREGTELTIHTLDSLVDGSANYAKGKFDLYNGTLTFDVFAIK